ncbi:long-chain fatty acid--CoA ligase [Agarilytica rhodophyticola]|uniref:long-chain fatty acid--CoA ligase n=1 Tax=Agarilytica rhodophyticola TaxID=1737490 RepID=UPI001FE453F0|nr:long-chain fatty acid--CoA ligase [Agarilytica rhodophyticola]
MIPGHMQQHKFNLIHILQYASRWHNQQEIVTNSIEGGIHRINYAELYKRTLKLANALTSLGVVAGDRIGTMAWNTWRHLECWYSIGGMGAICHTLNPRLFPDQIDYIVNHAEDSFIFVDITFVPVLANVIDKLTSLKGLIVLTDRDHMPDTTAIDIPVYCYEELLEAEPDAFTWPEFDEETASSLCYTSGTTGHPKGVLYSHRSNTVHALVTAGADLFNMTPSDVSLMVVPMFHANSWGLAYSVPMIGAKLVMPGPHMDGKSMSELINSEGVTKSAAVPTVWTGLINYLDKSNTKIPSLNETIIGGSAVSRSMIEKFERDYDVNVIQAWGMTETSPLGTISRPTPTMKSLDPEELMALRLKQGRAPFGVDLKIVDDEGQTLPHDGKAFGRLLIKGPWVIERYYRADESALDAQGWLDTGDIATIDAYGFMHITDRSKDLIKSGGEWISSIDIENTAVGHPDVNVAACIGAKHEKWEERPLLLVVLREGCTPNKQSILEHIAQEHAKWQVPDDVVFIDSMPLTATSKIDKKPLRKEYSSYYIQAC